MVDGADVRNHGGLPGLEARGNDTVPRIVKTQSSFSGCSDGQGTTSDNLSLFFSGVQVSYRVPHISPCSSLTHCKVHV